ncbi:MAG: PAS domain-containing protein [Candidatus Thiodiazotropha sp. (ex Gloverina cf. vestifex)]|nr:PAS domain-containing protein [Candidatus Thiodiazotropha sp. (ex Gloverina cf. vestifex)]
MPDSLFPELDAEVLLNALLGEIQDVGLVAWSAEGYITSLSESCARLMQLPNTATVGGPVSMLWESPCRDVMTAFDRFRDNVSEPRFEQELCLMRDGAPYWIDLAVLRCPKACGKTSAYMMVVRDITQKRHALTYAEKAQDLFDAVFRGISDAAIFVDPDRQILKVSMGAEAVFGYKEAELVGNGIKMLYAKDEDYDLQGRLRYNPTKASDYTTYVTGYRRKEGQPFSAATVGGSLHDRHGELLGYIEVLRDITDQMCLESDLREQSEMLNSIADRHGRLKAEAISPR